MDYFKDGYFAKRTFGVDENTQMTKEIRAVGLVAKTKTKEIFIEWELCLVSSNGAVMEVLESGKFRRFNGQVAKFDALKNSAIGLGIKQMIETLDFPQINEDLSNFPQVLNQE
jgi:hypothetical protein